nr:nucleocapsid protein [Aphid bunyavirus 1]
MNSTQNILPTNVKNVNIENIYAPGFLTGSSSNVIKNPFLTLVNEILEPLRDEPLSLAVLLERGVISADIDIGIDITDEKKATADMAFITFMLSQYHKDHRKNGTAAKYNINVGNAPPISFFCMKNCPLGGKEVFTTDNDMILASVLGLNTVVKTLRSNDMAGMHPLSRTAVTESGIAALEDYLSDSEAYQTRFRKSLMSPGVTAVKLYNTACARKSHQFFGKTDYYIPELAAAQLITGIMSSKGQNAALIDITNRNLHKMSTACGGLDKDVILDLMDFCSASGSRYDAAAIYNAYKNKTMLETGYKPIKSMVVPQGFTRPGRSTVEQPPVSDSSSPSTSTGQVSRQSSLSPEELKVKEMEERMEEDKKEIEALRRMLKDSKTTAVTKKNVNANNNNKNNRSSAGGKKGGGSVSSDAGDQSVEDQFSMKT